MMMKCYRVILPRVVFACGDRNHADVFVTEGSWESLDRVLGKHAEGSWVDLEAVLEQS